MANILQITIETNKGSVGRIAEQIGETAISRGWSSFITYARSSNPSKSNVIKIGSTIDVLWHALETRIFDNHAFSSRLATKKLINSIKKINPDIIHLHNLHGYFINIDILFKFLEKSNIPVIWTLHDCWSFTGHCAYFDIVGCDKWKTECYSCEQKQEYPKSLFFDRSRQNYIDKKLIFNRLSNLTIVPVSYWLSDKIKMSFLKKYPISVIQNGIDIDDFSIRDSRELINKKYGLVNKFIILGVASTWDRRKGLKEFIKLNKLLDLNSFVIILVGLTKAQLDDLPTSIIGIQRTESLDELADLYSSADVFVNPTLEDTFPTTNLEALACGTPIITYETGGSVESVCDQTGIIVEKGNVDGLLVAIEQIKARGKNFYSNNCRDSAVANFNKNKKFNDYFDLYNRILANKSKSAKSKPYQICSKTIMDTSDPHIVFNSNGESDYYVNFQNTIKPKWHTDESGYLELMKNAAKIKKDGRDRDFDCIIGLSGGLDSSYVAYVAKEIMGLRPLLFHVDAGWNTEKAVGNIEKLCNGLGLDLYTEVINWEEMKDLQVAFLKSQIADQDLPQDYAFFSALYKFAKKNKIKYVLTGGNFSTECCREPIEWGGFPGIDTTLVKDIHSKFGKKPLKTFPLVDILAYRIYYRYILGMRVFKPLNLVPFNKKDAEKFLHEKFGWESFQHKHHESRFTRFYEDFWLPRKFGYEKRRAHFSSLILTGQMTRDEALERISKPELSEDLLQKEFDYVADKLDLTREELQNIFEGKNKTFYDYKTKIWLIGLGTKVLTKIGLEKRLFR
jgi:N-acetyl sugar amidotransferase